MNRAKPLIGWSDDRSRLLQVAHYQIAEGAQGQMPFRAAVVRLAWTKMFCASSSAWLAGRPGLRRARVSADSIFNSSSPEACNEVGTYTAGPSVPWETWTPAGSTPMTVRS